MDEHALGLYDRITNRLTGFLDTINEHITRQELLAVGSVIGTGSFLVDNFGTLVTSSFSTVLFIAAVGYVMTYLV